MQMQAKELLDHLEGVLSSEPVEVVPGNSIVEVKPQGVSKGGVVERILLEAASSNTAHDVVLCIGDDRSDEDMYTAIEHVAVMPHMPAEVRSSSPLLYQCGSQPSVQMTIALRKTYTQLLWVWLSCLQRYAHPDNSSSPVGVLGTVCQDNSLSILAQSM